MFVRFFEGLEGSQNEPKFHFNTFLRSDTQKSSKKHENTNRIGTRCEEFWEPPQLATAILTNVIEHLVWLFAPQ